MIFGVQQSSCVGRGIASRAYAISPLPIKLYRTLNMARSQQS